MNSKSIVDIDLVKKYDVAGPRYTSYPTAPYFKELNESTYIKHLSQGEGDLSLYFHLPFCNSLCWFCGCHSMVNRDMDKIDIYIDYLIKEIQLLKTHLNPNRKVKQLHWGGGTPTHLRPNQIKRLADVIHQNFDFTDDAEIGVEVDPRGLTLEHVKALSSRGFNRCSMGVQDFNENVQKAVNRFQPENITRQSMDWMRQESFKSINLDMMYGLPFQTLESYESSMKILLELDADRMAVFNYAHMPEMIKHQALIKREDLPPAEMKFEFLKSTIRILENGGYEFIGMDHFAKPEDSLSIALHDGTLYRNFQGYSTHAGLDMLAIGITAIGMQNSFYTQNYKTLDEYYKSLDEGRLPLLRGLELSEDDKIRRKVINDLMCRFKIKKSDYINSIASDFDEYFKEALSMMAPFVEDELLELNAEELVISDKGRMLVRNIAMCFDYYFQKTDANKPYFSRTV